MKIAIIGCGLIGQRRAQTFGAHQLTYAVDIDPIKAQRCAAMQPGAKAATDWNEVMGDPTTQLVIVATTNDRLAEITLAAVRAGKHVLVEKPAARCAEELEPIIRAIKQSRVQVKVGFNHRYHPAIRKAKALVDAGTLGPLMYLRAVYGHGGRIGYDKEWRAQKEVAGGGELLDQGMHLVDLSKWFLGEFSEASGFVHTYFWDMPVEDNGFVLLKTPDKKAAWIHVSCSEWKNCFGMEIYGKRGKLHITGLGGSYGVERLTHYAMLPTMGPPETTICEFPFPDQSWQLELDDFIDAIEQGRAVSPGVEETQNALQLIERIYRGNGL